MTSTTAQSVHSANAGLPAGGSLVLDAEALYGELLQGVRGLRTARLQPLWVTRIAAGVTGFSAGIVFGASPYVAVLAFVAVLFSDWLGGILTGRRWPGFFVQMVVGAIAVGVAVVGLRIDPEVDVSAVIVAVIIVALAGMTVTGAVQASVGYQGLIVGSGAAAGAQTVAFDDITITSNTGGYGAAYGVAYGG